jgi:hypothetical protein
MNEQILFELLKEKLIPDLEKTDQYNFSDGTSEYFDAAVELKCRSCHYRYLLIQKDKYDKLMTSNNPRYINSIPIAPYQNTYGVYSWNLNTVEEPRWRYRMCIETTQFGPPTYVRKLVGFLDIHNAKNLTSRLFN